MTERAKHLLEEALHLPIPERTALAVELIASIDGPPDPDAETAWAAEIERRTRRVLEGGSSGSNWQDVRSRIKKKLRRG